MYVVSTQIYTELIFYPTIFIFVHAEGYNNQLIIFDTSGQQKKQKQIKHLFWLPRLAYFYITLICINEEFIPQWQKKNPIDSQPVLKTLVILTDNRVLKFFTTQSEFNFLLQSQIVYYCFLLFCGLCH